MNKRKIFIVILLVLLIAAGIGYWLANRDSSSSSGPLGFIDSLFPSSGSTGGGGSWNGNTSSSDQGDEANLPDALTVVTKDPIADYWIYNPALETASSSSSTSYASATSSESIFYLSLVGDVHVISDGVDSVAAQGQSGKIVFVEQNISGRFAIVSWDSGDSMLFDSQKRVWRALERGIVSASFSPDGKKLSFVTASDSSSQLYILDIEKNTLSLAMSLKAYDLRVEWFQKSKIAFFTAPSHEYAGQFWIIDLSAKSLTPVTQALGVAGVFSKYAEEYIVFISKGRTETSATLVSADGKQTALPRTIFKKCSFMVDAPGYVCAIPDRFSKSQYVLPDDYLKKSVVTNDHFIYDPFGQNDPYTFTTSKPLDAFRITASRERLYFINALDSKLYKLRLGSE